MRSKTLGRPVVERVLRGLYSVALYVLLPITVYHLIWRGFRQREYFRRWSERYAVYGAHPDDDAPRETLWVHAVSVGEVNAAAPLVNAIRRLHPHLPLLVTTITPTGSARVRDLWGDAVQHVYLPYDIPGAVRRFFEHFRPRAGLILETELWPNLLFGARDHGVPTYILNARLSARSLRGYRVLAPLVARALRTLRCVGAQSHADARRFVKLGARPDQVVELGNLKFDTPVPEGLDGFVATFRTHAGGTHRVDRGEHTRRRRGRGHRRAPPLARDVPGSVAVVGTASSGALPRGRRPRARRRVPRRDAPPDALARAGGRCLRRRHPGRVDAVLCLRARRLCRREPAAHRGTQPARTGGRGHRDRDRPAPA
jgi:hypothetical protein